VSLYDREYEPVFLALNRVMGNRESRMRAAADAMWRFFKDFGVSWVGFYVMDPAQPADTPDDQRQMVLGPARDKPACSPIAMHGACGMAVTKKRPLVITDVHNLGPNYIACDPKDKAEVVVPLYEKDGTPYGVLDVDSFDRSAFGEADVRALKRLVENTGISWPTPWVEPLYY